MIKHARRYGVLASAVLSMCMLTGAATEKRFPQLTVEQLTPEQHAVADEVLKVSSLGIQGPYNVMLRSPILAQRMVSTLDYLRFNTSVPRRLNEFAILIQSRLWTSQVEWKAHYPLALKAGLSEAVAADLLAGKRPASMQPDEAAVYDLCVQLSTTHEASDAVFAEAKRFLNDQQIVDLITLSGTYGTVAMLLAVGQEPTPDGSTPVPPLPPGGMLHASARP